MPAPSIMYGILLPGWPLFGAILVALIYSLLRPLRVRETDSGLRAVEHLLAERQEEHNDDPTKTGGPQDTQAWTVESLWIYPVKSCCGIRLSAAMIDRAGFEFDRQFMFVQKKAVKHTASRESMSDFYDCVTLRNYPRMTLVEAALYVDEEAYRAGKISGKLVVSYPQISRGLSGTWERLLMLFSRRAPSKSFTVPFGPPASPAVARACQAEYVKIWGNEMQAAVYTNLPKSLKEFLGAGDNLALARTDQAFLRDVYRCAPRKEQLGFQPAVHFQDAYPVHILGLASVQAVEDKLPPSFGPLSPMRFRPNILMSNTAAFEEDYWKLIKVGDEVYHVTSRTVRCKLPNVDPTKGIKHPSEPDKTLRSFRIIDAGAPLSACLGVQLVGSKPRSRISVGQKITVLQTGEHFYLKPGE